MNLRNVRILAFPEIVESTCPKCHKGLVQLQKGILSRPDFILVCLHCEVAYELGLVKLKENVLTDKPGMLAEAKRIKESKKCT